MCPSLHHAQGFDLKPLYTAEDTTDHEKELPGEVPVHQRALRHHVHSEALDH